MRGRLLSLLLLGGLSFALAACAPAEVQVVVTGGGYEDGCVSVTRVVEHAVFDGESCVEWVEIPDGDDLQALGGRYCLRAREVTSCGRCRVATSRWDVVSGARIPIDVGSAPWENCDAAVHGFDRSCADRGLEPVVGLPFQRSLQAAGSRACVLTTAGERDGVPTCWGSEPATDLERFRGSLERIRTHYAVGAGGVCGLDRVTGDVTCEPPSTASEGAACADPTAYAVSATGLCTICDDQVVCAGATSLPAFPLSGAETVIAVGPTSVCVGRASLLECGTPLGPRYALLGTRPIRGLVVTESRVCAWLELRDGDQHEIRCSRFEREERTPGGGPPDPGMAHSASEAAELRTRISRQPEIGPITSVCATDERVCWARGGRVTCDPASPLPHAGMPALASVACAESFTCGMTLDGSEVWCWGEDAAGAETARIAGARGLSPAQVCRAPVDAGA